MTTLEWKHFYGDFLQILYAKDMDQRSTTFEKSLAVGKEYQRQTRMLILRAAMLRHQIHVKVYTTNSHILLFNTIYFEAEHYLNTHFFRFL